LRILLFSRKSHGANGADKVWRSPGSEYWRVVAEQRDFRCRDKFTGKTRLGTSANGAVRYKAERRNRVWAWDFIHDRLADGRSIKCLSLVDEYTRLSVGLEVRRQMRHADVLEILHEAIARFGPPEYIRSDNGPEFIAQALRKALGTLGIGPLYIEPGAP
jgi:putative transposase